MYHKKLPCIRKEEPGILPVKNSLMKGRYAMKIWKRVLMVSMCVLLMTGITACGRNNADNGAGVNEATEGTDKKNEMNGAGTYNTDERDNGTDNAGNGAADQVIDDAADGVDDRTDDVIDGIDKTADDLTKDQSQTNNDSVKK